MGSLLWVTLSDEPPWWPELQTVPQVGARMVTHLTPEKLCVWPPPGLACELVPLLMFICSLPGDKLLTVSTVLLGVGGPWLHLCQEQLLDWSRHFVGSL